MALVALLFVGACDPVRRTVDFDRGVDFSQYAKYVWIAEDPAPTAAGEPPLNPLIRQRVQSAVARSLAAKGFREGSPADFAVGITLGVRERTVTQPVGLIDPFYDPFALRRVQPLTTRYVVRAYTEGTIAIDIYDTASGRPVWHGSASKPVTAEDARPEIIDRLVESVLIDFPPNPPPGAQPRPKDL